MADAGELKQWLDKQIEIREQDVKFVDFSETIQRCGVRYGKEIHIFTGIEEIAETLGVELKVTIDEFWGDCRKSVEYMGYTFYEII